MKNSVLTRAGGTSKGREQHRLWDLASHRPNQVWEVLQLSLLFWAAYTAKSTMGQSINELPWKRFLQSRWKKTAERTGYRPLVTPFLSF